MISISLRLGLVHGVAAVCALSLSVAQEPFVSSADVYLADGDPVEHSSFPNASMDWMNPEVVLGWEVLPNGFGPGERYAEFSSEVETHSRQPANHLRRTFTIGAELPAALMLRVKHPAGDIVAYLNGKIVLSLAAEDLPEVDGEGFRSYDLSAHITKLLPDQANLFALRVEGKFVLPILYGTNPSEDQSGIFLDPGNTRLEEGGAPAKFTLKRGSSATREWRVHLSNPESSDNPANDVEIRKDGIPIRIIPTNPPSFAVTFGTGEESMEFEISALDDVHAEAQESVFISFPFATTPPARFRITRNDTIVTRAAPSGEGSIGQALENANIFPGSQSIGFSDAEGIPFTKAPVTIELETGFPGHLAIEDDLVIEGPDSPGRVTIRANGVFGFDIWRPRGEVKIRRLVLRDAWVAVETTRFLGELIVEDCEFIDNRMALDLYSRRTPIVVRNCLITGSTGEAVQNHFGLPALLQNCTIYGNPGKVAISSDTNIQLDSCTIVGNGLWAIVGSATIRNCLFAGHRGVFRSSTRGDFDQGGNLFAEDRLNFSLRLLNPLSLASTSDAPIDPGLGELGFHGGFTRTLAIASTSPARDLGLDSGEGGGPPFDQRGPGYPRVVGPSPDAGAFELQILPNDLSIGAVTDPAHDPATGLYFQVLVINNLSPWPVSTFRIVVDGLPEGEVLYNSSGQNILDVAGNLAPSGYRVVVLQYLAGVPLRIDPRILVEALPGSTRPAPPFKPFAVASFSRTEQDAPSLKFHCQPGRSYQIEGSENLADWTPAGPAILAESGTIRWSEHRDLAADPGSAVGPRYYRVVELD